MGLDRTTGFGMKPDLEITSREGKTYMSLLTPRSLLRFDPFRLRWPSPLPLVRLPVVIDVAVSRCVPSASTLLRAVNTCVLFPESSCHCPKLMLFPAIWRGFTCGCVQLYFISTEMLSLTCHSPTAHHPHGHDAGESSF